MFCELFTNLKIRIILNALITVAIVEMFIPAFVKFRISPTSVPITIHKSNLFQLYLKYDLPYPIILTTASKLKIAAKPRLKYSRVVS